MQIAYVVFTLPLAIAAVALLWLPVRKIKWWQIAIYVSYALIWYAVFHVWLHKV
jgi:hypothetical protein